MKVSRTWLQKYFDTELPPAEVLADAFTFHAFEIEEVVGDMLDVKVLPDRAADCLSHRGIARELGAILNLPLKYDPFTEVLPEYSADEETLKISIEDEAFCTRYIGAYVTGVKVGPSPAWLKEAIESVGQRSINNVVDATNFVMLNIGQPLHAFDAGKVITSAQGARAIHVRTSQQGEGITTLTGEKFTLPEGTGLITDGTTHEPLGIAGIKGGIVAAVNADTTDLIIESAHFNGTRVRASSQTIKLFTDASLRYQNKISAELAAFGMRDVLELILEVAHGKVVTVVDTWEGKKATEQAPVRVTLHKINSLLGSSYTAADVAGVFDRLGFTYVQSDETFTVTPPFERRDITIPENLVEEVGQILGYEHITAQPLPEEEVIADQKRFKGIERIKDFMEMIGFIEISTQTFAAQGEIMLINPLDQTKPGLRTTLVENMKTALAAAAPLAPRTLGPDPFVKLFEIGTVFENNTEHLSLCFGYQQLSGKKTGALLAETASLLADEFAMHTSIREENIADIDLSLIDLETLGSTYLPTPLARSPYRVYSLYPFAIRDIAVWTPDVTGESEVSLHIAREAGDLLVRMDQFDRFSKEGRTSYAFRLIFQSFDRTLSDQDLDPIMEKITSELNAHGGWEVR